MTREKSLPRRGSGVLSAAVISNWNIQQDEGVPTSRRHLQRGSLGLQLTLAEIGLLMLFILMLALGLRLAQVQKQANDVRREYEVLQATIPPLKPLLATLRRAHQLHSEDPQELVAKFARATELEGVAGNLSRENSELRAQLAARDASPSEPQPKASEVSSIMERAAQIYPDDPKAAMQRALSVLERFGPKVDVASFEPGRDDRHEGSSEDGESKLPKETNASRAARSGSLQTTAEKVQRRPRCRNDDPPHWRWDRSAGQISAWCP